MRHIRSSAFALTALVMMAGHAQAAFYFEGLAPYAKAPNCEDPYAQTCGRYEQVPHANGANERSKKSEDFMHLQQTEDHKVLPGHTKNMQSMEK